MNGLDCLAVWICFLMILWKKDGQNHAEIDTISYPQKCRKSAVSGRCFYFWHCGSIGRTAPLPERIALFKGTL
nr:MAG TPA: hypothetical protein [Caudoviricetes sp.]